MCRKTAIFILAAAVITGCLGDDGDSLSPPPSSILFIGNSFTSANGGIAPLLNQLTSNMASASQPFTASLTVDGATLKQLWANSEARDFIRSGAYEVVVLQGDIPESDLQTFYDHSRKFVAAAKEAGTRPVLLMAWAYKRLDWITQDEIAAAHKLIAAESGVDVAPVGLAWSRVMAERPALDLYAADREHPSASGSYLAACVVYATVMGRSPEGAAPEADIGAIDEQQARYLERIAWDTVQAYRSR